MDVVAYCSYPEANSVNAFDRAGIPVTGPEKPFLSANFGQSQPDSLLAPAQTVPFLDIIDQRVETQRLILECYLALIHKLQQPMSFTDGVDRKTGGSLSHLRSSR
jgi:hypothetical protein